MHRRLCELLAALASILLVTTLANAQNETVLNGVVRDQSGGVVRDASVVVTPHGTGPARTARTDLDGGFAVRLPAGRYAITVERPGFRTLLREDVQLVEGQDTTLELTLENGAVSETVTVLGTRSRLATKAETPILQTPQAIAVVPEVVLDQQGANTLGEAVRNVSGVALSGNWRGTYEIFAQRGFYSDSDGNFRRNGIEISKFTSLLSPNAERIEVLKGPASILYGRVDPGGVINVVTKRPQALRFTEVEVRGGSFGYIDGRIDTTGPIGSGAKALYRVNLALDRSDSYRNEVERENLFVAPSVTFAFDSRTRWDIDVEHKREQNTVDVGIAAPVNSFTALDAMPIETFLGEPEGRAELTYTNALSTFERVFGQSWTFRNVVSYIDYDRSPHDVTLGALAADRRTIARTADFREQAYASAVVDATMLGFFSTGPLRHRIAAGATYHHTSLDQQQYRVGIAPIDIFQPVYSGVPDALPLVANSRQTVNNSGVFVQDQIELTSQLHVQAGVRASTFKQETLNRVTAATQIIDVDDVSGQVGAAYLPRPWFSVYGSYSQSFAPNLAIAADGSTFGPKTADQYEGGVKTDAWGGRLTATAAVFRLTYEGNLSFIRNPATGVFDTVQGGVQRSSGFELDVTSRPAAGVTVVGAFGTLNGRVVTDPVYLPGRVLGGAPDRRANLWVAWEMNRGLGVGGGVFYQSEFKEFTSSDFFLPAFTTIEAMASYRLSPRMTLRVHGKNLTDERYYLSGAGGFVAYPAPPRHVTASFVVRF